MKKLHFFVISALCCGAWLLHSSLTAPQGAPPEKVAKNFLAAFSKGDFDKAKKYGDDETDKIMDMFKMMISSLPEEQRKQLNPQNSKISKVECQTEGDKSMCTACCDKEGNALPAVLVKKINGQWLVSMNKEDMQKETPPDPGTPEEPEED